MVNRKRRPRPSSASASPSGASPPSTPSSRATTQRVTNSYRTPVARSSTPGVDEADPTTTTPLLACLALSQTRKSRDTTYTHAGVAGILYADLISWAVREVALRHRLRAHLSRCRARLAPPALSTRVSTPSQLMLHYSEKAVNAECSNCHSNVSASRYAQHLEKCLGRGGRVSSRAASARLKASAERAEREESEDHSQRRRRGGVVNDGDAKNSKRRRASPLSGAAVRLPPSGRHR